MKPGTTTKESVSTTGEKTKRERRTRVQRRRLVVERLAESLADAALAGTQRAEILGRRRHTRKQMKHDAAHWLVVNANVKERNGVRRRQHGRRRVGRCHWSVVR